MNLGRRAILAVWIIMAGCAVDSSPPWVVADAQPLILADDHAADALTDGRFGQWSTQISVLASPRRPLPGAGLQLPRVSPDGKWIAYLQIAPDAPLPPRDALITGRGLGNVQLCMRDVAGEHQPRTITSGGIWPTWIDNHRLMFVVYDQRAGCELGLYDVTTQRTRAASVGLRHIFSPAASPDGQRIAVAAFGELPDESVIFLVDVDQSRAAPGPPPFDQNSGAQLLPCWVSNQTLIYVELGKTTARLLRWMVDEARPHVIAELPAPPSVFDAQNLTAGIVDPLSPDLSHFALYLPVKDAITLVALADGSMVDTSRGTRAGLWWDDRWFIAAESNRLTLVDATSASDAADTSTHHINLLDGQWAPLWSDARTRSMLLAAPPAPASGEQPRLMNLRQLWLVIGE